MIRKLTLNFALILLILSSATFSSCSRKIFTSGNYYYYTHARQNKSPKHIPPRKCYSWFKYDSKRYLHKKTYGIKYSEKVNKNEKNVFE